MKFSSIVILITALLISGCTSIQVRPLSATQDRQNICIEKNEKVIVPDFLSIVRQGFARHGLTTQVYKHSIPATCYVVLTYTALRSWDFTAYLSHAELWLKNRNGKQIAYAKYHLNGKGGFDFGKWADAESKMDPVLDKLLANYK